MQVIWAPEAEETFEAIYMYILENWGASASTNFIKKTKRLLKSVSAMPEMFPETSYRNVRKAVIVPHSSLFYEVHEKHIGLLFFWDNRQEPMVF